MEKFRELKLKLISSKRDSQRLERDLLPRAARMTGQADQLFGNRQPAKLQDIKQEHYKLTERDTYRHTVRVQPPLLQRSFDGQETSKLREIAKINFMSQQRERPSVELSAPENAEEAEGTVLDELQTRRWAEPAESAQSEGDIFERLMLLVRDLKDYKQQWRGGNCPTQEERMAARLTEIKQIITVLQKSSQRKWLGFYEESHSKPTPGDNFNNMVNLLKYQLTTDRQALELSEHKSSLPAPPTDPLDNLQEIRKVMHFGEEEQEKREAECTFLDGLLLTTAEKLWNSSIEEQDQRKIDQLFNDNPSPAHYSPLEVIEERTSEYCSLPVQGVSDYAADVVMEAESAKYKEIFWTLKSNGKPKQQKESPKPDPAPVKQINRNGKLIIKFNRNPEQPDQNRSTTEPKPKQEPSVRARPNSIANRTKSRTSKPRK